MEYFRAGSGLYTSTVDVLAQYLYFFTREAYYTTIILSLEIYLVMVVLYTYKIVRVRSIAISGYLDSDSILGFHRLLHIRIREPSLTSIPDNLFIIYFEPENRINQALSLTLVASLSGLNRMDTLWIYLPSLFVIFWRNRRWRTFWLMAAGQIPQLLWCGFSLLYYGFQFPKPAHTKLNTGIPTSDLIDHGFLYFLNSLRVDPITLSSSWWVWSLHWSCGINDYCRYLPWIYYIYSMCSELCGILWVGVFSLFLFWHLSYRLPSCL